MTYTVRASNKMGAISFKRDTLKEAQQKVVELSNASFESITVRDALGNDVLDTDEERKLNERN